MIAGVLVVLVVVVLVVIVLRSRGSVAMLPTEEEAWRGSRWRSRSSGKYQGVTAYVGLPGSGKSYALVEVAVRALAEGREVWCNSGFDVRGCKRFGSFEEFTQIPNGAVVVWDELPLFVNARKWQEFPDGLMYRLTQIRKHGLELHYSTIDWRMVDVNVRRITFWTWECVGITQRLLRRRLYPPPERRVRGERARKSRWVWVKADIADAYDTLGTVELMDKAEADPPSAPTRGVVVNLDVDRHEAS